MEKSILDLATRSFTRPVQDLLVALLNEGNEEVLAAHSMGLDNLPYTNSSSPRAPSAPPTTPSTATTITVPIRPQSRHRPERYGYYTSSESKDEGEDNVGTGNDADEKYITGKNPGIPEA